MKKEIGLIGGDIRQRYLVRELQTSILYYANDFIEESDSIKRCTDLSEVLNQSDIIILPVPFTKDNMTIFSSHMNNTVYIQDLISLLRKEHIILVGALPKEFMEQIKAKGSKIIEFTELETFKENNAIPTGEGVIAELVSRTDITLHKCRALIIGYGYCGKRIAYLLNALGAFVFVYTKNEQEISMLAKSKLNRVQRVEKLEHMDMMINTIPAKLIPEEMILKYKLFIDITDAYNNVNSKNAVILRGIPGKYSPKTSGMMIGKLLNEILKSVTGEKTL